MPKLLQNILAIEVAVVLILGLIVFTIKLSSDIEIYKNTPSVTDNAPVEANLQPVGQLRIK